MCRATIRWQGVLFLSTCYKYVLEGFSNLKYQLVPFSSDVVKVTKICASCNAFSMCLVIANCVSNQALEFLTKDAAECLPRQFLCLGFYVQFLSCSQHPHIQLCIIHYQSVEDLSAPWVIYKGFNFQSGKIFSRTSIWLDGWVSSVNQWRRE